MQKDGTGKFALILTGSCIVTPFQINNGDKQPIISSKATYMNAALRPKAHN